jgi:3' exoribonuclease, RNase T-like
MKQAKLINVVLDLETVSTRPNAAILQIGAAIPRFDHDYLPSDFPTTFERTIRYEDVIALTGSKTLDMDDDTMKWWGAQPIETKRIVFSGQTSYLDAMLEFRDWMTTITQASEGKQVAVWGNDVGFDNVILTHSLDLHGVHKVWSYKNNRCFRTLRAVFPLTESQEDRIVLATRNYVKHTALGDARYEATVVEAVVEAYSGEDGLERWMI